jgi:hypothetical protein
MMFLNNPDLERFRAKCMDAMTINAREPRLVHLASAGDRRPS